MPITVSAKKKVRQDAKRARNNATMKRRYKEAVQKALEEKKESNLPNAYKELDLAAKKNIIHANKAARFKSRLAKTMIKKENIQKKTNTRKRKQKK